MKRRLALLAMGVPVLLLLPGPRAWIEASMLRHMLGGFPLLLMAGAVMSLALMPEQRARLRTWNAHGIPGLVLVLGVLVTWMVPQALDRATDSPLVDTAKALSLFTAGAALALSLPRAPLALQVFCLWHWCGMTAFIGVLYQTLPQRLCSAYLLDDQVRTGERLVAYATVIGMLWGIMAWRQYQRAIHQRTATAGAMDETL